MTNKEFDEMLGVFRRLIKLIKKYEGEFEEFEEPQKSDKPFLIPPEIYEEICDTLEEDFVSLFGIS